MTKMINYWDKQAVEEEGLTKLLLDYNRLKEREKAKKTAYELA